LSVAPSPIIDGEVVTTLDAIIPPTVPVVAVFKENTVPLSDIPPVAVYVVFTHGTFTKATPSLPILNP
jgi:hypothetical protein